MFYTDDYLNGFKTALSGIFIVSPIASILAGIRVPDLPYPVGQGEVQPFDWQPLLREQFAGQSDATVIGILKSHPHTWGMKQVNAAFLADRMMDLFLRRSGLHPHLVQTAARLRFLLALNIEQVADAALAPDNPVRQCLETFDHLRGWSDSGGRSARAVLDQLAQLRQVALAAFDDRQCQALADFVRQWRSDMAQQQARSSKLDERLLQTEQGAARQRAAEQRSRAYVGKALNGRSLAKAIIQFVTQHWMPVMRQAVLTDKPDGTQWRHAIRLLEWLVWTGDSQLCEGDRDRLYQVGEQLSEKIADLYQTVIGTPLDAQVLAPIEALLVLRLRGEAVEQVAAPELDYNPDWLSQDEAAVAGVMHIGNWYLENEGPHEIRRYLLAALPETREILWTNGAGVKLGNTSYLHFSQALANGRLQELPAASHFTEILNDTIHGLTRLQVIQQDKRQAAIEKAKADANALREAKATADRLAAEAAAAAAQQLENTRLAEAAHQAESTQAAAVAIEAGMQQQADAQQQAELNRQLQETTLREQLSTQFSDQLDQLKLGGWIELVEAEVIRLKLAVRINASQKFIFVDRHGLNRREILKPALLAKLMSGQARLLTQGTEFEDTLSRVVGRMRVVR